MKLVCCCLSQVFFFIKKLVSPDHHVEVQQHRSGGKGTRTTPHPAPQHIHSQPTLIPRTTPTPHTKGKKEKEKKRKGKKEREREREKGGPFVCGLGTMCGMGVGCKRICCGAGVN